MIPAGKYLATVKSYGVQPGDKPTVNIQFKFTDSNNLDQELWWRGWLTEKAIKITAKALTTCGFTGSDWDELSKGPSSNLLDTKTLVEIDVIHDVYNGKTTEKIAWINRAGANGSSGTKAVIDKSKFKAALEAARLEANKSIEQKMEDDCSF